MFLLIPGLNIKPHNFNAVAYAVEKTPHHLHGRDLKGRPWFLTNGFTLANGTFKIDSTANPSHFQKVKVFSFSKLNTHLQCVKQASKC